MNKTIKHITLISFILLIVELLLIALFCTFYFVNLFNFKDLCKDIYIIIGGVSLAVIDIIYIWIVTIKISHLRYKTDLKAAEIIGSDVQEAYNFAQVGLVITDENNIVLWTNDLFLNRHIELIDTNIFEWQPTLAILKDESSIDTVKIVYNSRNYDVKYLKEAGLWLFKDSTDYEASIAYQRDQAPVLGILSIDNYQDIIHDEEDYNDVLTKVRTAIFNYAKENGVLLRKIREDNYALFCNQISFEKMKANHFSLITQAREISKEEDVPLTISLGIATNFNDVVKLNELASSALEIAMSRGGDQVVVSTYGKEMEFYGGKTTTQEKRSRVKVRVLADSLISLIKSAKNVIVMGHTDMDMDAFGSCLGIKAICNRVSIPCQIVVDYKATESKTRSAIMSCFSKEELEELIIYKKDAENLINKDTLLIVCDVHIPSMTMDPNLVKKANKIVVIDHHRRAEEYIDSPVFNHIDTSASSACEIITEFIRFASITPRIELPSTYATIMLAGIFLDSGSYKNKSTGIRTFEASSILKEFGADNVAADDLLKDDFEEYMDIYSIVNNMVTPANGIVYAIGENDRFYDADTISKAANCCLSMKGTHASFAFGKTSTKEIKMSCRSDGGINVQLIAEQLGGGGHFTSAAVIFNGLELVQVEEQLKEAINHFNNDAKNDEKISNEMRKDMEE